LNRFNLEQSLFEPATSPIRAATMKPAQTGADASNTDARGGTALVQRSRLSHPGEVPRLKDEEEKHDQEGDL
jgi:hypothetical protein